MKRNKKQIEFKDRLQDLRKQVGTQEEVSRKLGINQKTLENWEQGVSRPVQMVQVMIIEKLVNLLEKGEIGV